MTDEERAIRELVDDWLTATQRGDLRAVLKLIDDDAMFMVPGQRPFGKEAFAIALRQMKDVKVDAKSDVQEVVIHGDLAYMRNYLELTMLPHGGGEPVHRVGHTLTILRKRPTGQWVIVRDANLLG
jgi:uncharacterized protein (TIGR02246 family)